MSLFQQQTFIRKIRTSRPINNRSKVNVNPLNNEDLYEIKYSSGTLLAIRVPKASRYQIPVFIGQNIMLPIKQTKKL